MKVCVGWGVWGEEGCGHCKLRVGKSNGSTRNLKGVHIQIDKRSPLLALWLWGLIMDVDLSSILTNPTISPRK